MHMCRVQCAHEKPITRTFVSNPFCPLWLHESSLSKTSCKWLRALEITEKKTKNAFHTLLRLGEKNSNETKPIPAPPISCTFKVVMANVEYDL